MFAVLDFLYPLLIFLIPFAMNAGDADAYDLDSLSVSGMVDAETLGLFKSIADQGHLTG